MKCKKIVISSVAAAVLAASTFSGVANAEVSASLNVASMYLWRGVDLGQGDPAISGDIQYSNSGFYTGIWGSSGDAELGNEYDLFIGYGGGAGDFSYDVSYWTYVYPSSDIDVGDAEDLVFSLGYGPASLTVYESLSDDDGVDARYVTLGYGVGKFSFLIGQHDDGAVKSEHVQLGYSYNDNLSFAVSKFLDDDLFDDDAQFLVSYSVDIK